MKTTFSIEGMKCSGCQQSAHDAIKKIAGVKSASVDLDAEIASVSGDFDWAELAAAIDALGYEIPNNPVIDTSD